MTMIKYLYDDNITKVCHNTKIGLLIIQERVKYPLESYPIMNYADMPSIYFWSVQG